jgi:hypothetical protein
VTGAHRIHLTVFSSGPLPLRVTRLAMPSGLRRLFGGGGGHGGGSRGVAGGGGAGSGGSGGGGAGSGGGGAPPSQAEPAASPAPPPPPPLPAYDGLDLCYVTPRLIVCGRPSARSTDIADHRNNVTALAAFLDKRHGGDYLVFNLSNKNRNAIDYGRFGNQVLEHQPYSPLGIVDDAPAVAQCFRILYSLLFWLEWGPETVAVLHCNSGVFRSGFIAACYLRYTGAAASIDEGLARFTSARFPPPPPPPPPPPGTAAPLEPPPGDDEAGGSAASAVLLGASGTLATVAAPALATAAASAGGSIAPRLYASWRFLQRHLEAAMGAPASIPRVHKLSYLILALPGLTTGTDGDVPVVVQLYQGPKVAFDSSKDCSALEDALRWEEGKLIVELPHPGGLTLCGDYQLWVLVAGARASESRLLAEHPTHPSFESTTPTPSMAAAPGGGLLGGVTLTDDEGAGGGGGVTPAETDGGGVGRLLPRDASGAGGVFNRSHHRRRGRRLVARLLFHSSVLDSGVVSFGEAECDIFHPKMERRGACRARCCCARRGDSGTLHVGGACACELQRARLRSCTPAPRPAPPRPPARPHTQPSRCRWSWTRCRPRSSTSPTWRASASAASSTCAATRRWHRARSTCPRTTTCFPTPSCASR